MNKAWDENFQEERIGFLKKQAEDSEFSLLSKAWMQSSVDHKYHYQFDWLGVPIIQMPGDLIVFQDIVYKTRPDLIIETGVARGGSLIFWASIQQLCGIQGKVLGIDIDIREHAHQAINSSRQKNQIQLLEGSSTDLEIFSQVKKLSTKSKRVMVVLDSNHTHEHVLAELNLYADLVTVDGMLLVLDTVIDELIPDPNRPWGPGASPKTAVIEFMNSRPNEFVNVLDYETKSTFTVAPNGFLYKIGKS